MKDLSLHLPRRRHFMAAATACLALLATLLIWSGPYSVVAVPVASSVPAAVLRILPAREGAAAQDARQDSAATDTFVAAPALQATPRIWRRRPRRICSLVDSLHRIGCMLAYQLTSLLMIIGDRIFRKTGHSVLILPDTGGSWFGWPLQPETAHLRQSSCRSLRKICCLALMLCRSRDSLHCLAVAKKQQPTRPQLPVAIEPCLPSKPGSHDECCQPQAALGAERW